MVLNTGSSSPGELLMTCRHLGGRRLLLQRLAKLARARLHLVEQPHVLDRDHRLVGEGGDQLDLLISERLNVEPRRHQDADELPVAQQRHAQHSAVLFHAACLQQGQFGIGVGVRDMDGFASKHHTADDRRPIRCDWMTPHMCDVLRRKAVAGDVMVEPVPGKPDGHPVGATKMPGQLDQRIEYRLQIEGRAADDLEHVGGGGLLLQAISRSSLSRRVFSMAMTAWAAKFWTSSICLSVKGRTSWR